MTGVRVQKDVAGGGRSPSRRPAVTTKLLTLCEQIKPDTTTGPNMKSTTNNMKKCAILSTYTILAIGSRLQQTQLTDCTVSVEMGVVTASYTLLVTQARGQAQTRERTTTQQYSQ